MKKLIATLAIAAIALTSTFAVVSSSSTTFDGSNQSAPDMKVTLNSTLDATNYNLSIFYGDDDFTEAQETTIEDLNLTTKGNTDLFKVKISQGNLNKTIIFTTKITLGDFIGTVDGNADYHTKNVLSLLGSDLKKAHDTTFTAKIAAGPQKSQSIAEFAFAWTGDEALPAGDYVSTNRVTISVN